MGQSYVIITGNMFQYDSSFFTPYLNQEPQVSSSTAEIDGEGTGPGESVL
jgi:hypothetical protein